MRLKLGSRVQHKGEYGEPGGRGEQKELTATVSPAPLSPAAPSGTGGFGREQSTRQVHVGIDRVGREPAPLALACSRQVRRRVSKAKCPASQTVNGRAGDTKLGLEHLNLSAESQILLLELYHTRMGTSELLRWHGQRRLKS